MEQPYKSTNGKILGVRVDSKLMWYYRVDHTCNNVTTIIAMLRRIKHYIDIPKRVLHFSGYILPIFGYCPLVWSTWPEKTLTDSKIRGNIKRNILWFIKYIGMEGIRPHHGLYERNVFVYSWHSHGILGTLY